MSKPDEKNQEMPELKATNYEMIPTEQIALAGPHQIFLMNPEISPDSIPPAQLVAMNGTTFLIETLNIKQAKNNNQEHFFNYSL